MKNVIKKYHTEIHQIINPKMNKNVQNSKKIKAINGQVRGPVGFPKK